MTILKIHKLKEELFERIFAAYVLANKSHWRTPPFDRVLKELYEDKKFTYTAGQEDNWSSKFVLTEQDNHYALEIVINEQLPASLQKYSEKIKEEAIERMQTIVN